MVNNISQIYEIKHLFPNISGNKYKTYNTKALYEFFAPAERFHFWCKRMFSYGLVENVDFTTVNFLTVVNQGGIKEIGDYLLTIDAAKTHRNGSTQ